MDSSPGAALESQPGNVYGGEVDRVGSLHKDEREEYIMAIEKRNELLRRCMTLLPGLQHEFHSQMRHLTPFSNFSGVAENIAQAIDDAVGEGGAQEQARRANQPPAMRSPDGAVASEDERDGDAGAPRLQTVQADVPTVPWQEVAEGKDPSQPGEQAEEEVEGDAIRGLHSASAAEEMNEHPEDAGGESVAPHPEPTSADDGRAESVIDTFHDETLHAQPEAPTRKNAPNSNAVPSFAGELHPSSVEVFEESKREEDNGDDPTSSGRGARSHRSLSMQPGEQPRQGAAIHDEELFHPSRKTEMEQPHEDDAPRETRGNDENDALQETRGHHDQQGKGEQQFAFTDEPPQVEHHERKEESQLAERHQQSFKAPPSQVSVQDFIHSFQEGLGALKESQSEVIPQEGAAIYAAEQHSRVAKLKRQWEQGLIEPNPNDAPVETRQQAHGSGDNAREEDDDKGPNAREGSADEVVANEEMTSTVFRQRNVAEEQAELGRERVGEDFHKHDPTEGEREHWVEPSGGTRVVMNQREDNEDPAMPVHEAPPPSSGEAEQTHPDFLQRESLEAVVMPDSAPMDEAQFPSGFPPPAASQQLREEGEERSGRYQAGEGDQISRSSRASSGARLASDVVNELVHGAHRDEHPMSPSEGQDTNALPPVGNEYPEETRRGEHGLEPASTEAMASNIHALETHMPQHYSDGMQERTREVYNVGAVTELHGEEGQGSGHFKAEEGGQISRSSRASSGARVASDVVNELVHGAHRDEHPMSPSEGQDTTSLPRVRGEYPEGTRRGEHGSEPAWTDAMASNPHESERYVPEHSDGLQENPMSPGEGPDTTQFPFAREYPGQGPTAKHAESDPLSISIPRNSTEHRDSENQTASHRQPQLDIERSHITQAGSFPVDNESGEKAITAGDCLSSQQIMGRPSSGDRKANTNAQVGYQGAYQQGMSIAGEASPAGNSPVPQPTSSLREDNDVQGVADLEQVQEEDSLAFMQQKDSMRPRPLALSHDEISSGAQGTTNRAREAGANENWRSLRSEGATEGHKRAGTHTNSSLHGQFPMGQDHGQSLPPAAPALQEGETGAGVARRAGVESHNTIYESQSKTSAAAGTAGVSEEGKLGDHLTRYSEEKAESVKNKKQASLAKERLRPLQQLPRYSEATKADVAEPFNAQEGEIYPGGDSRPGRGQEDGDRAKLNFSSSPVEEGAKRQATLGARMPTDQRYGDTPIARGGNGLVFERGVPIMAELGEHEHEEGAGTAPQEAPVRERGHHTLPLPPKLEMRDSAGGGKNGVRERGVQASREDGSGNERWHLGNSWGKRESPRHGLGMRRERPRRPDRRGNSLFFPELSAATLFRHPQYTCHSSDVVETVEPLPAFPSDFLAEARNSS